MDRWWIAALLFSAAACAEPSGPVGGAPDRALADTASTPNDMPASALGAYLSARIEQQERNLPGALRLYQQALARDPENPDLTRQVFVLAASEGEFDLARPLAAKLLALEPNSPLANLVTAAEELKQGHAAKGLAAAQKLPDEGFYRFAGGLTRAWLMVATKSESHQAIAALDGLDQEQALQSMKLLHAALISDLAGDAPAADGYYHAAVSIGTPALRLVQLAGNYFERAGQIVAAKKLYDDFAAHASDAAGFVPKLSPDGRPGRLVPDATAGLAEAMFDMASLVSAADSTEVAMLNVRLALELKPDFALASLLLGDILDMQNHPQAAIAAYRGIDRHSPYDWAARLREAAVLDATGDHDGAEKLFTTMAAERPEQIQPLVDLGNAQREQNQFTRAVQTYSQAIGRLPAGSEADHWALFYSRGIANERAGDWPAADADLRKALALRPNEPDVMNYLGYSMVDRDQKLPEAVDLIKRAVDLKPKDGFVVDSLGWAYYRMGKFPEAERTLERAVELEPGDAEINAHLGDAYAGGGRAAEARLQWQRALSLKPDADLARRIQAELDQPAAHAGVAAAHAAE